MPQKIWFITGVSSGIGWHLAKQAAIAGHCVIGTVRQPEQIANINQVVPGSTFGHLLDVNNHEQVQALVANIVEQYGRIDVVVNNAGFGYFGAVEAMHMTECREQMETNFFGALAVTQAVLPYLRAQKSGHLIQVSSIAGLTGTAGLGLYNASKHALEGLSEALYYEVAHLGIHVTLVEPGPFRTLWAGASMKEAAVSIPDYDASAGMVQQRLANVNGRQPGDPEKAALAILHITEVAQPPLRLALGKMAVEVIKKKIALLNNNLTEWETLSAGADFDE